MLGLPKDTVALSDPDPIWAEVYARERARLQSALGPAIDTIEHVGSTAIPGLRAKPIIDIAAGIPDFDRFFASIPVVENLGYEFQGEFGIPRRHFFVLGDPRTVHLHFFETDSQNWREQLLFRDTLRHSATLRAEYTGLKDRLAQEFAQDRASYTAAKADFIQRVLREAAATPAAPPSA